MGEKDVLNKVLSNGLRKEIAVKENGDSEKSIVDLVYPTGVRIMDFSGKKLSRAKSFVSVNGMQHFVDKGTKWEDIQLLPKQNIEFSEQDFE